MNQPHARACEECGQPHSSESAGKAKGVPAGESRIPAGVDQKASIEQLGSAPSKQFSLWAHYRHHIHHAAQSAHRAATEGDEDTFARSIRKLLELAWRATFDHEIATGKRTISRHEMHSSAVDELLRDYLGVPALQAACMLGQSERWVRDQRGRNGRDAEYGHERNDDPLTARIMRLRAAGASERTIAAEVGLSKTAVHHRLTVTALQAA